MQKDECAKRCDGIAAAPVTPPPVAPATTCDLASVQACSAAASIALGAAMMAQDKAKCNKVIDDFSSCAAVCA